MKAELFSTILSDSTNVHLLHCRDAQKKVGNICFLSMFLLLFVCSSAHSQWLDDPILDQRVLRGIDKLYNYEFDRADSDFLEVIRLRPDHPAGYFFRAMIQWERIISNFDDES